MNSEKHDELPNERARQLLKVLVERYIEKGLPLGSRTLARGSGMDLSPATIRNVMADLEEHGFIVAPHTSAGRVPTQKGYRLFVDMLVKLKPPTGKEIHSLEEQLSGRCEDIKSLVESASTILSSLTHLAGVVTVPRQTHRALSQIEFLPLSDRRVLAIMVVNNEEVQNRILHLDRDFSADELRRAANYLNQEFAGRDLDDVRQRILEKLRETRANMNQLMADAIQIASAALSPEESDQNAYILAGQTNLMDIADLSDVDKLRELFDGFTRQRDILHLLDQSLAAGGIQIFIGQESGYRMLDECSLVAAPYEVNHEVVGVLAVIGPTRMAYERIIPIVDVTAKLLGSALNSRF